MSDFKYAAINAALVYSRENDCGPLGQLFRRCEAGEVPVVDATSAWEYGQTQHEKFLSGAAQYCDALESGVLGVSLSEFLMFVDVTKRFRKDYPDANMKALGSVLAVRFTGVGTNIECVHLQCGLLLNGSVLTRAIHDKDDAAEFNTILTCVIMCIQSWMAVKNAEIEHSPAPRGSRRRHAALVSVRFRRVFIRPTGIFKRMQRYEVTGSDCPLHHVRGHIRHVSEDRPLFGRKGAHGTFWISEHFRGDEDNGRIIQEYVPMPQEAL